MSETGELLSLGVSYNPLTQEIHLADDAIAVGQELCWRRCQSDYHFFILESGLVKTIDHNEKWDCHNCGRIMEAASPEVCTGPEWDEGCGSEWITRRPPCQPGLDS